MLNCDGYNNWLDKTTDLKFHTNSCIPSHFYMEISQRQPSENKVYIHPYSRG